MRRILVASLMLLAASQAMGKSKAQPYSDVSEVVVQGVGDFTTETRQYRRSNRIETYHVVMIALSDSWRFELSCSATWRWQKCGMVGPGRYHVRIRGTEMVFLELISGADFNRPVSRRYHILQAEEYNPPPSKPRVDQTPT